MSVCHRKKQWKDRLIPNGKHFILKQSELALYFGQMYRNGARLQRKLRKINLTTECIILLKLK